MEFPNLSPNQFQKVMKMPRKTIEISRLIEKGNQFLLDSADDMGFERISLMDFLFDILHETGNYKGFRYLCAKDMAESDNGKSVGIIFDENGDPNFNGCDNSRIKIL